MDEREIVAPVIDDFVRLAPSHACKHAQPGQWMRPLDDPRMFANRLPFSDHDQSFGIDMQTDTAVSSKTRLISGFSSSSRLARS